MSKAIAEQSNALSVFWLKKHGYFPVGGGWRSGGIKWTYGLSGNESSIEFEVFANWQDTTNFTNEELKEYTEAVDKENYIRLYYTHTNRGVGEKESIDLKILLTTTPCNYGGVRYWFICPLFKNGQYCGRRVGVIYRIGKYFGCRHCGEIAYNVQMKGGKFRGCSVSFPDIEKAEQEVKRKYYNGKITRKYRRVIRMNEKLNNELIGLTI